VIDGGVAAAVPVAAAIPDDPPPPHATMPSGSTSPMKHLNVAILRGNA